jgi:UDP-sulfoquinovose synthase
MEDRLEAWREVSGREIRFAKIDLAQDPSALLKLLKTERPGGVVHFAEQRAAPYSMKSSAHKIYTVNNNVNATNNLLCAIVESGLDVHLVHLGTMGVYGYDSSGKPIPEGYLTVTANGKEREIPYPPSPGSIYHMTKVLDAQMFAFYARNDLLRITDLHQGIVWGTNTKETSADERLINRFDYDGDYGTVLNRFLMQGAIGHPLTVHGSGGQKRAFIHIRNTVECVRLALENPPGRGDRVEIFNQVTETHTVRDLAAIVSKKTGVEIRHLRNPRIEVEENDLAVTNDKFMKLGLNPVTLEEGLLDEVISVARKYADRCSPSRILSTSKWRADIEIDERIEESVSPL